MTFNRKNILALFITGIIVSACTYSFTGASIPPHLETIAIPIAADRTSKGEATLSDDFTNELVTKFLDDNSFQITSKDKADCLLECTLTRINEKPETFSTEAITQNKLTVTAKVVYRDLVMKKVVFNKSFSNFANYNTDGDQVQARLDAIQTAIDKLTEDILLAVVSNW